MSVIIPPTRSFPAAAAWGIFAAMLAGSVSAEDWEIVPASIQLQGAFDRAQLLVREKTEKPDRAADLTHRVRYESSDPNVVSVTPTGGLLAIANGQATVTAFHQGESRQATVKATGVEENPRIDFAGQVLPILSKAGCNAGACHASQYGKGGFKLSVFAFEPSNDYDAILRDRQGRRVNWISPERSLLLRKPTLELAHGGNQRLRKGSPDYHILRAWLVGGGPQSSQDAPKVVGIKITPSRLIASLDRSNQENAQQQLRVVATHSDQTERDVTCWAKFDSMDEGVATVSEDGLIGVHGRGQAPIMVRFAGQAEISMVVS
ncbi:MAG: Ig-like domain-containing protein, partial [Planctomycetales bacterium]